MPGLIYYNLKEFPDHLPIFTGYISGFVYDGNIKERRRIMSLKKLLFKNKKSLFKYMFGAIMTSGSNVIFTIALSQAFNIFSIDSTKELIVLALQTLVLVLLPVLLQIISRFLRIGFMTDILKEVRIMTYHRIMNLDTEGFKEKSKEDYQSQLISDINLFEKDFFLSVLNIVFAIFSTLISLIVLTYISWRIALISVVTSIVLFVVTKIFEKGVRQKRKQSQNQNKVLNEGVNNLVKGAKTLKHYSVGMRFLNLFHDDVEKLEVIKSDYFFLNKTQESISEWIAMLAQMVSFVYATYLLAQGRIDIPAVIIVLNMMGQVVWVMISAFGFMNRLRSSVDIYNSLVDYDIPETSAHEVMDHYDFNIKDLSYAYDKEVVIHDLNLEIKENEKVLIYGPTGSGKTTFLNCLSQNLKGYQGSILVGNKQLKEVNHNDFLNHTAYVRQNHFMFEDTLKNNIILNCEYNEAKFRQVLKDAALEDWIESLDDKEDHRLIQNGSNISGGQRQRVSIARELYSNFDIIFVDEPSASLDDDNAEIIYDTLLKLNKTVICVTHRHIEYLKDKFDKVISFEGGTL